MQKKRQLPKLKAVICHLALDVFNASNTLPRTAYSNGVVIMKSKRKLQYRDHVYFELMGRNFIQRLQQFFKQNNSLYHDIAIYLYNVSIEFHQEINQDNLPHNMLDSDPSYKIPLIVEENRIGQNSIFQDK